MLSDSVSSTVLSDELVNQLSSNLLNKDGSSGNVVRSDDLSSNLFGGVFNNLGLSVHDDYEFVTVSGNDLIGKSLTGGVFKGLLKFSDHLALLDSELVRKRVELLDLSLLLADCLLLHDMGAN